RFDEIVGRGGPYVLRDRVQLAVVHGVLELIARASTFEIGMYFDVHDETLPNRPLFGQGAVVAEENHLIQSNSVRHSPASQHPLLIGTALQYPGFRHGAAVANSHELRSRSRRPARWHWWMPGGSSTSRCRQMT